MAEDHDYDVIVLGAGARAAPERLAIAGGVPPDRLWHAVPSYPTISEVWLRLLQAYGL
jgi:dihydrolipoamide dehydrogenase